MRHPRVGARADEAQAARDAVERHKAAGVGGERLPIHIDTAARRAFEAMDAEGIVIATD